MSDTQQKADRRSFVPPGPVTEGGKALIRFPTLKTNLDADADCISTESQIAYRLLIVSYYDRYLPEGPIERFFVDTLVRRDWTLKRLYHPIPPARLVPNPPSPSDIKIKPSDSPTCSDRPQPLTPFSCARPTACNLSSRKEKSSDE